MFNYEKKNKNDHGDNNILPNNNKMSIICS